MTGISIKNNGFPVRQGYLAGTPYSMIYYGLLIYTILFYSQIAARFPVLAPLRLELLVGTAMVIAAFLKLKSGEIRFSENGINRAALYFFIAALLTIPFAFVISYSVLMFISVFKFFAIYLMIITAVDSEKKLQGFIYVYLAMITLLFIQPFILSLMGKGFVINNHMLRLAGVTGYFSHPNQLGGITSENLPFFYFLMRYEKSKLKKVIYFILILISIRVVMLTQSRTGFLGVLAFGFFVWFFSKNKIISLAAVFISLAVVWQFAPQETKDRFLTITQMQKVLETEKEDYSEEERTSLGSMASRLELLRRGFIIFLDNPIIGVGLDNFKSVNLKRWNHWFPPHNTYIQALAEMGIVGFSAFIYLIVMIFKNLSTARKIVSHQKERQNYIDAIISAVTTYMLIRLVVSFFGQDLYGNYWWLAGGLSLVLVRIAKQRYQSMMIQEQSKNV